MFSANLVAKALPTFPAPPVIRIFNKKQIQSSYEKAGKQVAHYCHKGLDLLKYFKLVLFSYLCGNNEMHLKNFLLMHQPEDILLSQVYNLLNVNLLNPKDEEELALTLMVKRTE